jgi:hypothetical protein
MGLSQSLIILAIKGKKIILKEKHIMIAIKKIEGIIIGYHFSISMNF